MTKTKTKKKKPAEPEMRVRILQEDDAMSPRDWDNVGKMVCWHGRYDLGDEQPKESPFEYMRALAAEVCPRLEQIVDNWENRSWNWLEDVLPGTTFEYRNTLVSKHLHNLVEAVLEKHYIMLPLYLFDHSGLSMSTSSSLFRACDSAGWDWGKVGFIYCTRQRGLEECESEEKAIKCMMDEVETYDQYLRGAVYYFLVEKRQRCDKCGHIEWEVVDSCSGFFGSDIEANGMLEHIDPELHEMARQAEVEYPR